MFEQLVRPFTSRQITTTRRIVPIKREANDTPEEAILIWGSAGTLPREVVQPKGVNLENIENVGFNVRGNIDNWNQTSREGQLVDVPITDSGGNQIGTTVIDRTTAAEYTKPVDPYDYEKNPNAGYYPNFHGVARVQPQTHTFTGTKSDFVHRYPQYRDSIPSADTDKATYKFQWQSTGG